jgi:hypothetical protein
MITEELTPEQQAKAEEIVQALKTHQEEFKKRYGPRWRHILHALTNKQDQKSSK